MQQLFDLYLQPKLDIYTSFQNIVEHKRDVSNKHALITVQCKCQSIRKK